MVNFKWRYILPLFYILVTAGYCIIVYLVVARLFNDAIPIIRGPTSTDLFLVFVGVPIIMCIFLLFAKIVVCINFKILSKFELHYNHYVIDMGDREVGTITFFNRALVPVFLSLALSLLINNIAFSAGIFGKDPISSIIFLSLLLAPLTFFLLLPIWIFQDSGIIKLRIKSKDRNPPNLTFFGNFQYQSMKGFAGITTPIMYIITIYGVISISKNIMNIVISLIVLLYPLFLMGFFMPALLLYERRIKTLREKVVKMLKLPKLTQELVDQNIF